MTGPEDVAWRLTKLDCWVCGDPAAGVDVTRHEVWVDEGLVFDLDANRVRHMECVWASKPEGDDG